MDKDKKLQLPQVTLMAMSSTQVAPSIKAMQYSMRGIDFGDAVLITHRKPLFLPKNIRYGHIDPVNSIDDFNYHMVYDLIDYIHTDYVLVVHADGFVVHPECWRDEFLEYDYIGSPWPMPPEDDKILYHAPDGRVIRVGNSVSLRSRKLLALPKELGMPWSGEYYAGQMWYSEDNFICCRMRHLFEEAGCTYAPIEVAKYFGHERMIPEIEGITPFVFHKWDGTNAGYPNFIKPTIRQRLGGLKARIVNGRQNRQ